MRASPHGLTNSVGRSPARGQSFLPGLPPDPYVYFAHSITSQNGATAARCTYGVPYTAVLEDPNVFGVQFHPEKSDQ